MRRSLSRPPVSARSVSRANPTTIACAGRRSRVASSTSSVGTTAISPRRLSFLIFCAATVGRPEVGRCRRHDEHVGAGQVRRDGFAHVVGRLDGDDRGPDGRRDSERPRNESDVGAATPGGARNGDAHLAAAPVRHEPYRIDRLARAAGGHDDAPSAQQSVGVEQPADVREDRLRFRHPARPTALARREGAGLRLEYVIAELAEMRRRCEWSGGAPTCDRSSRERAGRARRRPADTQLSRSFAWPCAARAMKSAVAGATTMAWADRASAM